MKTKTFFQVVISLFIIISLNSCADDTIEMENEGNFKIVPLSEAINKTNPYTDNYMVDASTTVIDIANDEISMEIPVPFADYTFLEAHNISSTNNAAILYVMERGSENNVLDQPINYVVQTSVSISSLNLNTNLLNNGNGLRIFVMNNAKEVLAGSSIYTCLEGKVDDTDINANKCISYSKADGPKTYNGSIIML